MRETQPKRGLSRLFCRLKAAKAAGVVFFSGVILNTTACDILGKNFSDLPFSGEKPVSEEESNLTNRYIRLDGSGFILIPNTNNFPKDNFAVEILLKPDAPSKLVSQNTEDSELLFEDVYTIFAQHNGQLEDFTLLMHARGNPDSSITYSYTARLMDKNSLDISKNVCPVIAGYGGERKASVNDFTKPKKVILKVREGELEVFESGRRIGMSVGYEYITPEGNYTLNPEEYRGRYTDDAEYIFNTLVEVPCDIGNVSFGIGGAMFPDGSLSGHFDGTIYKASIRNITELDGLGDVIAEWNFGNGLPIDVSGNGYNGGIVGKIPLN